MRGLAIPGILILVSLLAACGGGDDPDSTPTPQPTTAFVQGVQGARTDATASPAATAAPASYTVVSGDTLFDIAVRFGTTVEALVTANALADADTLAVGQELKLPPRSP